jgi:hypothetical protein
VPSPSSNCRRFERAQGGCRFGERAAQGCNKPAAGPLDLGPLYTYGFEGMVLVNTHEFGGGGYCVAALLCFVL